MSNRIIDLDEINVGAPDLDTLLPGNVPAPITAPTPYTPPAPEPFEPAPPAPDELAPSFDSEAPPLDPAIRKQLVQALLPLLRDDLAEDGVPREAIAWAGAWLSAQPPLDLDDRLQQLMATIAVDYPQERDQLVADLLREVEPAARALGASESAIRAGMRWLRQNALRPVSPERTTHAYWGIDTRQLPELDQPWLIPFLNAMHRAGVNAEDVSKLINAYGHTIAKRTRTAQAQQAQAQRHAALEAQLDARTDAEIEKQDARDRAHAEQVMRQKWGSEYDLNVALIKRYIDNLPAEKRDLLETAQKPDGGLWLNDPECLRDLAQRARDSGLTRQEIEHMMQFDRARYQKDAVVQAHYRDYIRGTAIEPAPKQTTSVNDEIAHIEHVMKTDRKKYLRDEKMQARYRELLRARG